MRSSSFVFKTKVNKTHIKQIQTKIITTEQLKQVRTEYKSKKIVMCSGCYDILHPGHVVFFDQCKQIGDILVVNVGRDVIVEKLKGNTRPVVSEQNRQFLLAAITNVDYVVLGAQEMLPGKIDFHLNLQLLSPDIFVVNEDDSAISEKELFCNHHNIELVKVARMVPTELKISPTSTTEIITKIIQKKT